MEPDVAKPEFRTAIVWFRRDLRVDDNPALVAALNAAENVIPVFIWAPEEEGQFQPGRCSRWWTKHSLIDLQQALAALGSKLVIRRSTDSTAALLQIVSEVGAEAVFFNHLYDPISLMRDHDCKRGLTAAGVAQRTFNGDMLYEPWDVLDDNKQPLSTFSDFWASVRAMSAAPPFPVSAPPAMPLVPASVASLSVAEVDWFFTSEQEASSDQLKFKWKPGVGGAIAELERFVADRLVCFEHDRAKVDRESTSRLSPWIHSGSISVRYIFYRIRQCQAEWIAAGTDRSRSCDDFLQQMGYREYSRYLAFHFPFIHERSLLRHLRACPWRIDQHAFKAWRQGQTGYPIVDAAMRQLWSSGWCHNRGRVVAASFLVKDLLLPWQWGLKHYWDAQIDADLECDALGWQYVSGGMSDAHPFSYMMDLEAEARRFDPDGEYVRRWLPVLSRLPTEFIHAPWKASPQVLAAADVELGCNYPRPIVTRADARAHVDYACSVLDKSVVAEAGAGASEGSGPYPYRPPTYPVAAAGGAGGTSSGANPAGTNGGGASGAGPSAAAGTATGTGTGAGTGGGDTAYREDSLPGSLHQQQRQQQQLTRTQDGGASAGASGPPEEHQQHQQQPDGGARVSGGSSMGPPPPPGAGGARPHDAQPQQQRSEAAVGSGERGAGASGALPPRPSAAPPGPAPGSMFYHPQDGGGHELLERILQQQRSARAAPNQQDGSGTDKPPGYYHNTAAGGGGAAGDAGGGGGGGGGAAGGGGNRGLAPPPYGIEYGMDPASAMLWAQQQQQQLLMAGGTAALAFQQAMQLLMARRRAGDGTSAFFEGGGGGRAGGGDGGEDGEGLDDDDSEEVVSNTVDLGLTAFTGASCWHRQAGTARGARRAAGGRTTSGRASHGTTGPQESQGEGEGAGAAPSGAQGDEGDRAGARGAHHHPHQHHSQRARQAERAHAERAHAADEEMGEGEELSGGEGQGEGGGGGGGGGGERRRKRESSGGEGGGEEDEDSPGGGRTPQGGGGDEDMASADLDSGSGSGGNSGDEDGREGRAWGEAAGEGAGGEAAVAMEEARGAEMEGGAGGGGSGGEGQSHKRRRSFGSGPQV